MSWGRGTLLAIVLIASGATTGVANAASFTIAPAGRIRWTSLGKVTFESTVEISCNLTFTGGFAAGPIPNVVGSRLGEITRVESSECSGGEIEAALNLPWWIKYQQILGALPSAVTGFWVAIEDWDMRLSAFGGLVRCRYIGEALWLIQTTGTNPFTTGLSFSLENEIPFAEGSVACPRSGRVRGVFAGEPAMRITVR